MLVFREIWRALFSSNTRLLRFVLLPYYRRCVLIICLFYRQTGIWICLIFERL